MDAPFEARPADTGTAPPFEIADRIAAAVGGPVIVEDASFRVLGYSAFVGPMDRGRAEAILGRRTPEAWLEHLSATGSLLTLRSSTEVVDLLDGPWQARRRLITAFRAGARVLGFAWVAEGTPALRENPALALRRAVDDATPDLLRYLEQVDATEQHAARQVHTLLDGLPGAPTVADRFGLRRDGHFVVLSVPGQDVEHGDAPSSPGQHATRLVEHLGLCLQSLRRRTAITSYGTGAAAIVAVGPDESDDTVRRLAAEVVRLGGTGPLHPLRVAVSSVGAGIAEIPRLRDEAVAAGDTLRRDVGGTASYPEVEASVLVARAVDALPPGARLTGLDRLREVDHGSGDLERTVRAYLAASGRAATAARALGVHVTTVRHRLERVRMVSGLRLDDPDVRIACELLLRATLTSGTSLPRRE